MEALLQYTLQRFSPSCKLIFGKAKKLPIRNSKQALPNSSDKKHLSSQLLLPSLPLPRGPPRSNVNNTAERERRGSGEQLENILFRKPDLRRAEREERRAQQRKESVWGKICRKQSRVPLSPPFALWQTPSKNSAWIGPSSRPFVSPPRTRTQRQAEGRCSRAEKRGGEKRKRNAAATCRPNQFSPLRV